MNNVMLEFITEFDVTLVIEQISIDDDNRKYTETIIDASDFTPL